MLNNELFYGESTEYSMVFFNIFVDATQIYTTTSLGFEVPQEWEDRPPWPGLPQRPSIQRPGDGEDQRLRTGSFPWWQDVLRCEEEPDPSIILVNCPLHFYQVFSAMVGCYWAVVIGRLLPMRSLGSDKNRQKMLERVVVPMVIHQGCTKKIKVFDSDDEMSQ